MLSEKERPFVEVEADACHVYAVEHVVEVAVCPVSFVKTLAVAVAQPIVDVAFGLESKFLKLELTPVELRAGPSGIEVGVHVNGKIELVGLLFDLEDLLDQSFLVVGPDLGDLILLGRCVSCGQNHSGHQGNM